MIVVGHLTGKPKVSTNNLQLFRKAFRLNMFSRVFFATLFATVLSGELSRAELEKKILTDIYLQSKFHSFVRPHQNGSSFDEPVSVNLSLYIIHLEVNAKSQEYDITMYFRQGWHDSRLAYENQGKLNYIAVHDVIGFWTPDLFFVNEKSAHLHVITKPNTFTRIYPDGNVFYSQRLSMKASCPMDLGLYPFDKQTCNLQVESYGYAADDLVVGWKESNEPPVAESTDVIGYEASTTFKTSIVVVGDKRYSVAVLEIDLKRELSDFFFHLYVPLTFLVVASWIPFWLNPKSSFIRLTVSLTSIATSLLQLRANDYLFVTPGYPTALDVWVAFCCILTFAAFFENVCVIYTWEYSDGDTKTEDNALATFLAKMFKKMDATARTLFPCCFLLLNIFYIVYIVSNTVGL